MTALEDNREALALGQAWRRCEAALPEGWHFEVDSGKGEPMAHACPDTFGFDPIVNTDGPTPTAALEALAAKLEALR